MTKFEELVDIITRNKNNSKKNEQKEVLEVAGSENTKQPLISFADMEDLNLLDQLYYNKNEKHKPLEGQSADKWDN
jgi:hypothetical protein